MAPIHNHTGMTIAGTTAIIIARKNAASAALSSLAPRSLACFSLLATGPSARSLIPPYPYNTQKSGEKGCVKSRRTAQTMRVIVIRFAKLLIQIASLNSSLPAEIVT